MAFRDNRIAAEATGINVTYYKLMAFVVAAFFAGVAGVLYGHNLAILTAGTFDYNKSIEILVIVVLGGMGSIRGSVIAAVLITVLPEALRSLQDYRMTIYALLLIVIMLLNASPKFAEIKGRLNCKTLFTWLGFKMKKKNTSKEDV
jgi:branched-chain amino acid transport system permease protein